MSAESRQAAIAGAGLVIEDPLVLANAAAIVWDDETDVIVIGLGGAGAAAALEAREKGADVVVIERFEGGGSTVLSGGVFYAGATRFQRDAGFDDTAQGMFDYLRLEVKDAVSEDTLRRFCDNSAENVDWLIRHGVNFRASLYSGKTSYPPEGKFLYFSGNENVPAFAARAKPAPRGLRTVGKGLSGYAFFGALNGAVAHSGVRTRTHSRALRLIVDEHGTVIGVETLEITQPNDQRKHQNLYARVNPTRPFSFATAEKATENCLAFELAVGTRKRIRARGGLILATGGFSYNAAMLRKHMPFVADRMAALMRLGSMGCNGSGMQLGASVGGATRGLDRPFLARQLAPPSAVLKGLLVNQQGQRFINEDAYSGKLGGAIAQQPGGDAWIILDSELHSQLLRQTLPVGDGTFRIYRAPTLLNRLFGGTKRDRTLSGLARKIGADPVELQATVATMRSALANKQPDPLGKNPDYCRPLGEGPYWALNTSIGNKFSFVAFFTLGGLAVNEQSGAVVRDDGTPIEGLYAAGRAALGIPSDGYISGLSLADCVFSGRRAGQAAASKLQQR
ncbi:MAG: FAD-binding protein [Pseudomonadota bacterium]